MCVFSVFIFEVLPGSYTTRIGRTRVQEEEVYTRYVVESAASVERHARIVDEMQSNYRLQIRCESYYIITARCYTERGYANATV